MAFQVGIWEPEISELMSSRYMFASGELECFSFPNLDLGRLIRSDFHVDAEGLLPVPSVQIRRQILGHIEKDQQHKFHMINRGLPLIYLLSSRSACTDLILTG